MKGIIFGAGEYGKKAYKGLTEYYGVEILAFCDNDSSKWGERLYCCPVISPEELSAYTYDCIFISTRRVHAFKAVKKQLVDMGIEEKKIDILQAHIRIPECFYGCKKKLDQGLCILYQ